MTVLALDPGLRTGWCRSDGTNGVFDMSGYADRGEALALFQRWLADGLATRPTMYLAVEKPYFGFQNEVTDFTNALIWTANATAWLHDVPRTQRRADDVRKALLGRCRKLKGETTAAFDAVILGAVQARGFYPTSEHAADAAALLCVVEGIGERVAA
jgi:uncharacterized membrane protein